MTHILNSSLRRNEKEAWKSIFRDHYIELLYVSLSYKIDHDNAKDLVQSTFLKLWEHRVTIKDEFPVKSFLFTIHRNNCLDYLRRQKTGQQHKTYVETVEWHSPSFSDTPHDQYTSNELEFQIIEAIAELPDRCRQVFEYSRFKGLKNTEIAELMDLSVKTVENQMTIALDKLRKKLVEYLPFIIILYFFF